MIQWENRGTLFSLLGLLHPAEYFVTIDHSVLWQRHIAWSKPKGEELRQYVTQRYSSNMIFLSCMLAAEINVFFNSSVELTDMRHLLQMGNGAGAGMEDSITPHYQLRYWIGITMLVDACVTLVALVTTFTLWGMVSSISDANTHALLRCSIGQYVTSLPSRFTVGALYLFLLWMIGFIINLVNGTIPCGCLVLLVFGMFFQVVIPLSAFGRLIIHTGAMAKRPVLDEELEQELLPSGLHASLLIRATDRRRKYSCATDQYRKQNLKHFYANNSAAGSSRMTSVGGGGPPGPGGGLGPTGAASRTSVRGSVMERSGSGSNLPPGSSIGSSPYYNTTMGGNSKHYPTHPHHTKRNSSTSQLVPPRTITATIRTSNLNNDENGGDGDNNNNNDEYVRARNIREDSDEITIDLEEEDGDGGGGGGLGEKEPLLLSRDNNIPPGGEERHAHFLTTTPTSRADHSSLVWSPDDEAVLAESQRLLRNDGSGGGGGISTTYSSSPPSYSRRHRRMETSDTVGSEFFFPRASVLNAALSTRELDNVVQNAILESSNIMSSTRGMGVVGGGGHHHHHQYQEDHQHNYNSFYDDPHGGDYAYNPRLSTSRDEEEEEEEDEEGADVVKDNHGIPESIIPTVSGVSPLASDGFPTPKNNNDRNNISNMDSNNNNNRDDSNLDTTTPRSSDTKDDVVNADVAPQSSSSDRKKDTSAATAPTITGGTDELPPPPPPPPPSSDTSGNNSRNNNTSSNKTTINKNQEHLHTIGNEGTLAGQRTSPRFVPPLARQGSSTRRSSPKVLQRKQAQPDLSPTTNNVGNGIGRQQQQDLRQKTTIDNRHPLLSNRTLQQQQPQQQQQSKYALRNESPPRGPSQQQVSSKNVNQNQRPKPHHRRRDSAGRRSSSSLLGFLGVGAAKEEREWEEENEVRAMFDALPSADLDSHDQIMEELEYTRDNNMVLTSMAHPLKKHTAGSPSLEARQRAQQWHQQQQQQQTSQHSPFVSALNDINRTHDGHNLHQFDNSTSSLVYITPTAGAENNGGFGPLSPQPYQYPKSALRSRTGSMTGSGKRRHRRLNSLPPTVAPDGMTGPGAQQTTWSSPLVQPDNNNNNKSNRVGTATVTNEQQQQQQAHQSFRRSSDPGISPQQYRKSQLPQFSSGGRGGSGGQNNISTIPSPSQNSSNSRLPRYGGHRRRPSQTDNDANEDGDVGGGGSSRRESLTINTTSTPTSAATTSHPSQSPTSSSGATGMDMAAVAAAAATTSGNEEDVQEGTHLLSGKGKRSNIPSYSTSSSS